MNRQLLLFETPRAEPRPASARPLLRRDAPATSVAAVREFLGRTKRPGKHHAERRQERRREIMPDPATLPK